MAVAALALPRHDAPDADAPHLGPASASDGGTAHIGGVEPYRYVWYEPAADLRPCPFCSQPIGDKRCIAIMEDGSWRWADIDCAVFAKKGRSDMVPGAPWKLRERPNCARCGGRWKEDHCHAHGGVWCDDECSIAYEEPANA